MKPLYLADMVRNSLGPWLRPGGDVLTRITMEKLELGPGKRAIDAGCGKGSTLELCREYGMTNLYGVDLDFSLLSEAVAVRQRVVQANMDRLPVRDGSVDCVISECAWNLSEKERSLSEFYRILKPGGMLAISDIYLRSKNFETVQWPIRSCFAGATGLDTVLALVLKHGFSVCSCEDYTHLLKQTAAEFIFTHGSIHQFWEAVTGCPASAAALCKASRKTRPGLFLLLAQRGEK